MTTKEHLPSQFEERGVDDKPAEVEGGNKRSLGVCLSPGENYCGSKICFCCPCFPFTGTSFAG